MFDVNVMLCIENLRLKFCGFNIVKEIIVLMLF